MQGRDVEKTQIHADETRKDTDKNGQEAEGRGGHTVEKKEVQGVVAQTIVGSDVVSKTTEPLPQTSSEKPSPSSLRTVLASLVSDVKENAVSVPPATVTHSVPAQMVVEPEQSVETKVLPQAAPQEDTNLLSPKKLERMMRVTGGDKSPLS
jgi:hypothetical protein